LCVLYSKFRCSLKPWVRLLWGVARRWCGRCDRRLHPLVKCSFKVSLGVRVGQCDLKTARPRSTISRQQVGVPQALSAVFTAVWNHALNRRQCSGLAVRAPDRKRVHCALTARVCRQEQGRRERRVILPCRSSAVGTEQGSEGECDGGGMLGHAGACWNRVASQTLQLPVCTSLSTIGCCKRP
jgi:hypothetical protein